MLKIDSIIEANNANMPNIQKNLQYLILVAKTNGKKNAIHEKPGSASLPYLPLKKAFTTSPWGEIKIGKRKIPLIFTKYPFSISVSILSNLSFISDDTAIKKNELSPI